jgi:hypothetical protein
MLMGNANARVTNFYRDYQRAKRHIDRVQEQADALER